MITEITDNPFRILGLPANAKREEIDECHKMLIEGMSQQAPDSSFIKEIDDAYHAVTSPEHHWHHASFWFIRLTTKDEHAIQLVEEGRFEDAANLWEESKGFAASHNLRICYLMQEVTIPLSFSHARNLFLNEDFFDEFVECVGESDKSAEEAAKVFLDTVFSQTTSNKATLYTLLGNKEWMAYVRGKWVEPAEADEKMKEMQESMRIRTAAAKEKAREEAWEAFLKWIWILLFPIILIGYYVYKNNHKPKPVPTLQEMIKEKNDRREIIYERLNDTTTLNKQIRDMGRNTGDQESTSLRDRILERRKSVRESASSGTKTGL